MIGDQVKRLRNDKGLSLSELAKSAGISKSYLSQIERGIQSNPSLGFLKKIAVPLKTTVEFLLETETLSSRQEGELDEEWKSLIQQATEAGLKKEDFQEYLSYIQFQKWVKQQKKI